MTGAENEAEIDAQTEASLELADRVAKMLHGQDPEIVSVVLAHLTATLLAGYFDSRGPEATAKLRMRILTEQVGLTRRLILPMEQRALAAHPKRRMH